MFLFVSMLYYLPYIYIYIYIYICISFYFYNYVMFNKPARVLVPKCIWMVYFKVVALVTLSIWLI